MRIKNIKNQFKKVGDLKTDLIWGTREVIIINNDGANLVFPVYEVRLLVAFRKLEKYRWQSVEKEADVKGKGFNTSKAQKCDLNEDERRNCNSYRYGNGTANLK